MLKRLAIKIRQLLSKQSRKAGTFFIIPPLEMLGNHFFSFEEALQDF